MWGHHQPDVSDHPEHDGDAPDGVVAVPLLLLGHQDEPEVGQDVGAQHLSVVYLSLLVFLRSECRNTQLCGWCQLVWRNSGNCDLMLLCSFIKPPPPQILFKNSFPFIFMIMMFFLLLN